MRAQFPVPSDSTPAMRLVISSVVHRRLFCLLLREATGLSMKSSSSSTVSFMRRLFRSGDSRCASCSASFFLFLAAACGCWRTSRSARLDSVSFAAFFFFFAMPQTGAAAGAGAEAGMNCSSSRSFGPSSSSRASPSPPAARVRFRDGVSSALESSMGSSAGENATCVADAFGASRCPLVRLAAAGLLALASTAATVAVLLLCATSAFSSSGCPSTANSSFWSHSLRSAAKRS
mmetsp:Transcript_18437/g.69766  ORF Transcript_18437/g.69766 Transcript_18437/m.69766 type:complete len:233 (-) Transcript_18437:590-1288(-)